MDESGSSKVYQAEIPGSSLIEPFEQNYCGFRKKQAGLRWAGRDSRFNELAQP